MINEIKTTVESDSKLKAKCRALQNHYREQVLNEKDAGKGPYESSDARYGNMLVNGEKTGKNFISDAAFEYAKQKVRDKFINPSLTVDQYRLFNNMLSSMPMCFNLFSDLRRNLLRDQEETSQIIKMLFTELKWILQVEYIDIEFIPTPIIEYTNDKSAFDAVIITTDIENKKGLIAIETKYTDILGSNISSKNNDGKKNELITSNQIFEESYLNLLLEKGYRQIDRNYLLTFAYAKKNGFNYFANVIISPEEDRPSSEEIKKLKTSLLKNKDSILKISLEEFVQRGKSVDQTWFVELMEKFYGRYLDWEFDQTQS